MNEPRDEEEWDRWSKSPDVCPRCGKGRVESATYTDYCSNEDCDWGFGY